MAIDYDQEVADGLGEGMNLGGAVELPFLAPFMWVINGDAKLRALATGPNAVPALFYGGFSSDASAIEAAMEQYGVQNFSRAFAKTTATNNEGKTYEAMIGRSIIVAPIDNRFGWVAEDGTRYGEYVKGARQHVQALCFAASHPSKDDPYTPMFPVVLTAKGYQARNLLKAFSDWNNLTLSARQKLGKNGKTIPAWCFYLVIGTFGDERKQIMVGSAGTQSPITPIGAWLPKQVTPEGLEALFVGREMMTEMLDLKRAAKEWLGAFATPLGNATGNGHSPKPAPPMPEPEDAPFLMAGEPGPEDYDPPF